MRPTGWDAPPGKARLPSLTAQGIRERESGWSVGSIKAYLKEDVIRLGIGPVKKSTVRKFLPAELLSLVTDGIKRRLERFLYRH
jgi:hypothetical protein